MSVLDSLILAAVILGVVVLSVMVDPRAKLWLSDAIERFACWACCDLRARAEAQRAARNAWRRVYDHAKSLPMGEAVRAYGPVEPPSRLMEIAK